MKKHSRRAMSFHADR